MLYTEQSVLSAVAEGKLFLAPGDRLTPSARDLLRQRGIVTTEKKPEHMTHLNSKELVNKTHPRIAFRGKLDSLEAELLLYMKTEGMPQKTLEEMLDFCRSLMRADVLGEEVAPMKLHGMDEEELHTRSHNPKKYYGLGHFLPKASDSLALLRLNRLRTMVREAELQCYHAFPKRRDLHMALNRLSSLCWVLCLELKQKEESGGAPWTSL